MYMYILLYSYNVQASGDVCRLRCSDRSRLPPEHTCKRYNEVGAAFWVGHCHQILDLEEPLHVHVLCICVCKCRVALHESHNCGLGSRLAYVCMQICLFVCLFVMLLCMRIVLVPTGCA